MIQMLPHVYCDGPRPGEECRTWGNDAAHGEAGAYTNMSRRRVEEVLRAAGWRIARRGGRRVHVCPDCCGPDGDEA